jgi:hypothetical protein
VPRCRWTARSAASHWTDEAIAAEFGLSAAQVAAVRAEVDRQSAERWAARGSEAGDASPPGGSAELTAFIELSDERPPSED